MAPEHVPDWEDEQRLLAFIEEAEWVESRWSRENRRAA